MAEKEVEELKSTETRVPDGRREYDLEWKN